MRKLFVVLTMSIIALASGASAQAQKPNIVVVMTDDQPLGSESTMSTVQALAETGIRFTNAYSPFPLCAPNRATLLTGQLPMNHGVIGNGGEDGGGYSVFREYEADTLGAWMQAAGYRTAMVGKHINRYHKNSSNWTYVPPGWDDWQAFVVSNAYYDYSLNENGNKVNYGHSNSDYSTDVLAEKAVEFIDNSDGSKPLFMLVTPYTPHDQIEVADRHKGTAVPDFEPSPAFNNRGSNKPGFIDNLPKVDLSDREKEWRKQVRSLMAVDDMLAAIVAALDEKGILGNTYIIFTSDHGMAQGDYRWTHKRLFYGQVSRVILVVNGPGIEPGERDQLVTTADITTTILDLAGATPTRAQDGVSLSPLFAEPLLPWRTAILLETRIEENGKRYWGVATDNFLYVVNRSSGKEELYDRTVDPYDLDNVADEPAYAASLAAMAALKDYFVSGCTGAGCWYDGEVP